MTWNDIGFCGRGDLPALWHASPDETINLLDVIGTWRRFLWVAHSEICPMAMRVVTVCLKQTQAFDRGINALHFCGHFQ
jgi:hypothetical protein